jgi:hypothetical protein
MILSLVAHSDAAGGGAAHVVFEGPGQPAVSGYAATSGASVAQPYFFLLLQYDHVAATYTAFYRYSAAAPWAFLAAYGANVVFAGLSAPRVGVGAKSWVTGRTWSCAVDAFFLTALPNVPYTAAWPAGLLRACVVAAVEAPPGVRANVARTYAASSRCSNSS